MDIPDLIVHVYLCPKIQLLFVFYVCFKDCLPGWILYQTNCYLLVHERPQSWDNAEIDCLNRNAELLYLLTPEEEEFIDSQTMNRSAIRKAFIGLKEDENDIKRFVNWSSGNPLEYTNWHGSQIEEVSSGTACVAKNASVYGQWEIVDCLRSLPYICKKKGKTGLGALD